jgi:hypothetical protein
VEEDVKKLLRTRLEGITKAAKEGAKLIQEVCENKHRRILPVSKNCKSSFNDSWNSAKTSATPLKCTSKYIMKSTTHVPLELTLALGEHEENRLS